MITTGWQAHPLSLMLTICWWNWHHLDPSRPQQIRKLSHVYEHSNGKSHKGSTIIAALYLQATLQPTPVPPSQTLTYSGLKWTQIEINCRFWMSILKVREETGETPFNPLKVSFVFQHKKTSDALYCWWHVNSSTLLRSKTNPVFPRFSDFNSAVTSLPAPPPELNGPRR